MGNLHEIGKGPAPFDQGVMDTGSVSQAGVPVGVGGHVVKTGPTLERQHARQSA